MQPTNATSGGCSLAFEKRPIYVCVCVCVYVFYLDFFLSFINFSTFSTFTLSELLSKIVFPLVAKEMFLIFFHFRL